MTEILSYRYIGGQTGENSSKPSPSQFQLYVKDSRKDEDEGGETYWINAQLAGSLWPLAVADFYLEHLVISQQEEEGEEEGEHEAEDDSLEDLEDVVETIWDLCDKGETLLQTGFKVTDIAFTFDVFLPIEGEGTTDCLDHLEPQTGGSDLPGQPRLEEEEEEDKGVTLLLFYVEMSREDSQEDVILQLDDLRLFAPRELLKFLESSITLKSDEEEDSASEATEEDLVST